MWDLFRQSGTGASLSPTEYIRVHRSSHISIILPSSSTCSFYKKDKWTKPEGLSKSNFLSEVGERLIETYFHFFFPRWDTVSWKSVCTRKALRTAKSTDVLRVFFLGPRPHAELINKIYIALRASHAAPPPRPKETKIFFKSQPSIDDQYFVVISSSKTQNSFQMFGRFAVQHNPTGHFPSSYLVFPTFYLATSPPLPQGRADCLENFRAVTFLTSPTMMMMI